MPILKLIVPCQKNTQKYLEFFTIPVNIFQNLLPEEFVHVNDALEILSSRLVHDDKKSSESACLAMSRLAESYKNDKTRLRDIAKPDVLANLQQVRQRPQDSMFIRYTYNLSENICTYIFQNVINWGYAK